MSIQNNFIKSGSIKSFVLILLVLAAAMFPRLITAVGAPAFINFLHFAFVVVLMGLMLSKIQSHVAKEILLGLLVLLGIILSSALVNSAGVINVVLDFLLLGEPFLLLLAIISIPMARSSIERFQFWLMLFVFIHIVFAYFQFFVLNLGHDPDNIKGIFLNMGAGHHVGGAVALTAAVYFFVLPDIPSMWLRMFFGIVCLGEVLLSDAKQVIAVFLVALVALLCTKLNNIGKFLQYFIITIVMMFLVIWAAKTIFPALALILDVDRLNSGLNAKFSVFSIIISYFNSYLNWFLGLGPGHTVGRLGWLIPDYLQYLKPLGVTTSPIFDAVFTAQQENYYANAKTGSSLYSLLFSWAGVWGDLGIIGLVSYIYLWFLVWRNICADDLSRFYLLTVFVFGIVFSWMEEPGYMLFVTSLIGLQWQKHQNTIDNSQYKSFKKRFMTS